MTYVIWDHDRNQRVAAYSFQSAAKAEKAALRIAKQYSSYAASFKVIPLATAKKREKEQTIYRKATGNPRRQRLYAPGAVKYRVDDPMGYAKYSKTLQAAKVKARRFAKETGRPFAILKWKAPSRNAPYGEHILYETIQPPAMNPAKWIPVTGVRLLPNGQVQIKVRRRS